VTGRHINDDGTVTYSINDPANVATSLDDFVYTDAFGRPEFVTRGAVVPAP
jgi:hypothetical protein